MIIHLRGPLFLPLEKEGVREDLFFLGPYDVLQSVPKVCPYRLSSVLLL
jgi:hypothetical protein